MEAKQPVIEPGFWSDLLKVLVVITFLTLFVPIVLNSATQVGQTRGDMNSVVLIQLVPATGHEAEFVPECKKGCTVGSGVTVPGGFIITAAHVIRGGEWKVGDTLTVLDYQGIPHEAKVLARNDETDVAVLKYLNWASGPTSPLLCNPTYQVGDEVIVRGGPLFLGLVNTYGRIIRLETGPGDTSTHKLWPFVILVDAETSYGNSGGPVYDAIGRVIGILVGGVPADRYSMAFSTVVPAHVACDVLTALAK